MNPFGSTKNILSTNTKNVQVAPPKVFIFDNLKVFFKHTDYHGYVHPYNFFEWTSYIREAYFQQTVQNFLEVLSRPIKMMTVKINCSLLDDSQFGDSFEARLTVGKIKKVSFDMIIRFFNLSRQKVVCETTHTVVFVDSQTGNFANIPEEMSRVIVNYEEKEPAISRSAPRESNLIGDK